MLLVIKHMSAVNENLGPSIFLITVAPVAYVVFSFCKTKDDPKLKEQVHDEQKIAHMLVSSFFCYFW